MSNYTERQRAKAERLANEMAKMQNFQQSVKGNNNHNSGSRPLKAKIDITPTKMDDTYSAKLITSRELDIMINQIFRDSVAEYVGSRIYLSGSQIMCDIFLEERKVENGYVNCLRRRGTKDKSKGAIGVINSYNNRNAVGRVYELTEEGKDLFSEFVPNKYIRDFKNHVVNYDACGKDIVETDTKMLFYKIEVDLRKILEKRYGKYTSNGEKIEYEIGVIRPITTLKDPTSGALYTTEWMFNILQMNNANVIKANKQAGFGGTGELGIVRDYR